MVEPALDGCVAPRLFSRLGLGESAALVRRRRNTDIRRDLDGQSTVAFQSGCQFACRWRFLDLGCRLAIDDWTLSCRRHRLHVGHAILIVGAPALQLSHWPAARPFVDTTQGRVRQTRASPASRDRCRTSGCLAFLGSRTQHELRLPRPCLPSLLGTVSRALGDDLYSIGRTDLLADSPFARLVLSSAWPAEVRRNGERASGFRPHRSICWSKGNCPLLITREERAFYPVAGPEQGHATPTRRAMHWHRYRVRRP